MTADSEPGNYTNRLSIENPVNNSVFRKAEGQRYGRYMCYHKEGGTCMLMVCDADWVDPEDKTKIGRVTIWPDCKYVPFGDCPDAQDKKDPESVR